MVSCDDIKRILETMANCRVTFCPEDEYVRQITDKDVEFHAGSIRGCVKNVVDPEKKKKLVEKKRDEVSSRIASLEKQLSNVGFLNKADPKLVQERRDSLSELKKELAELEAK